MTTANALPLAASLVLPLIAEVTAVSWAVVGFCIILGLIVTLGPSKRTSEFKNPYED